MKNPMTMSRKAFLGSDRRAAAAGKANVIQTIDISNRVFIGLVASDAERGSIGGAREPAALAGEPIARLRRASRRRAAR